MGLLHPDTVTALLTGHAAERDLTIEGMLSGLDAAGFWPPGWPLARRLAHQRGWSHPALEDSQGPFVVSVWDSENSPTPIVLYKHYAAWTVADAARIIAHIRAQTEQQQAEVRALRGTLPGPLDNQVRPRAAGRLRSGDKAPNSGLANACAEALMKTKA